MGQIKDQVTAIFNSAAFIQHLGIRLVEVTAGTCETSLEITPALCQQHGFVHAGVVATLADHTAGGAARSASGSNDVITIEFKINFLRPATGPRLRCRAKVVRAGKAVVICQSEVFDDPSNKLVALLTETLQLIPGK